MSINKKKDIEYLIPEIEIKKIIKNTKIDLDNVKCEHCGKILSDDNIGFYHGMLCRDCYNLMKESHYTESDFIEYCRNSLHICLNSADYSKMKLVLINRGYTYKDILFTIKYLSEIKNRNLGGSIGLVYYYIDTAIKYAEDNNVDLSIIPRENYFEESIAKMKKKGYKLNIKDQVKKYLKDKLKEYIYNEYTKVTSISEGQLEDYMVEHLYLIEDGMKFVDRQRPIKNGIIDIAAKDKNNVPCIIELKNNDKCERLKRQCIEYPEMFKNKNLPYRMITLTTGYKGENYDVINNIGYVEMYKYNAIYGNLNNPIKELYIEKIN